MSIDFEKYKALTQQLDDYTDIYTDLHPPILYDAVDAINELLDYIKSCDAHIKIQYHNEELTVSEICERLERAEEKLSEAVQDMKGICYLCGKAKPSRFANATLKTCEHFQNTSSNKRPRCEHFEWKGFKE